MALETQSHAAGVPLQEGGTNARLLHAVQQGIHRTLRAAINQEAEGVA